MFPGFILLCERQRNVRNLKREETLWWGGRDLPWSYSTQPGIISSFWEKNGNERGSFILGLAPTSCVSAVMWLVVSQHWLSLQKKLWPTLLHTHTLLRPPPKKKQGEHKRSDSEALLEASLFCFSEEDRVDLMGRHFPRRQDVTRKLKTEVVGRSRVVGKRKQNKKRKPIEQHTLSFVTNLATFLLSLSLKFRQWHFWISSSARKWRRCQIWSNWN